MAVSADAEVLAQMNREFNGVNMDPSAVAATLRRSSETVAVAFVGAAAAGFACAQVQESLCYKRPWAELTELYVRSGFRRRGLGRRLVAFIEKELRRRDVGHIHILTGMRNRAARALYETCGYSHNVKRPEVLYEKDVMRGGRSGMR
jgi:GNAT superfamily N-acetyltransferase